MMIQAKFEFCSSKRIAGPNHPNFETSISSECLSLSHSRVGKYVKVYGQFEMLDPSRVIVGFQITPIIDFNELTCHLLHVCNRHAELQYNFEYRPPSPEIVSV